MPKKYCFSLTTRPPFPCHAPINPEAALLMTAFVKNVPIYEQTTSPKGRAHTRCISKKPLECLLNGSECCDTCIRKKKVIDMTYKSKTCISECLDMIKDPFSCKPQAFFKKNKYTYFCSVLACKETLLNIWEPLCLLFCTELRPGDHIAPDIYLKGLCCTMTEFLFGLYIYLSIHLFISLCLLPERKGVALHFNLTPSQPPSSEG